MNVSRAREQSHFDARYASFDELKVNDWRGFREAITPAHLQGGSPGGVVHLRAYELVGARDLTSVSVLDYACGTGRWAVHLASLGAHVSGFDLSPVGVERARQRAASAGVEVDLVCADAAALPYEDSSFDIVVGIQALHHTIKYVGTNSELHRVMKPGGIAIFTENLGHNPLIQLARKITMLHNEAGDVILTESLAREWASDFADVVIEPYNLLMMAKRVHVLHRALPLLHRLDEQLLSAAPFLRRYCGECVIVLHR